MINHHCRKIRVKQEPHRYHMTKDTHTVYTHQVTSETQKDYQNKRTSTDTTADWYMCLSSVPETDPGATGVLLSMFYAEHPVLLPPCDFPAEAAPRILGWSSPALAESHRSRRLRKAANIKDLSQRIHNLFTLQL